MTLRKILDLRKVNLEELVNEEIVDTGHSIILKNDPLRIALSFPKYYGVDFFSLHIKVVASDAADGRSQGLCHEPQDEHVLAADLLPAERRGLAHRLRLRQRRQPGGPVQRSLPRTEVYRAYSETRLRTLSQKRPCSRRRGQI